MLSSRLLRERDMGNPDAEPSKTLLMYNEWDCKASHMGHAKEGRESGFLQKWFGLETKEGCDGTKAEHNDWTKLEDGQLGFREFHLILRSDKTVGKVDYFSHLGSEGADPENTDCNPFHPDYYCCTIVYDWRPEFEADCRAWTNNFAAGDDGHVVTAESDGCYRCDLLVSADENAVLRTGFYEEWDSQKSQYKYAGVRVKAEFMQHWFNFSPPFNWPKLQGDKAEIRNWKLMFKAVAATDP